jgi:nucleoside-diphosphate-sugar epimerase
MRGVIIGGTGFLGYFTCRDLIAAGHEAVAVGLALPDPGTMPDGAVVEVCNADSCGERELAALLEAWAVFFCA